MLFDLRSRGRRRTVQVVYLGLAMLMGGGLVLFGVGTGSGNGGLLNAFGGDGSNQQSQIISSAEKAALKQTQKNPSDPAAWAALETARYQNASSAASAPPPTRTPPTGKKELARARHAWQKYLTLSKNPAERTSRSLPPTPTLPSASTPTRPPPGSTPPRRTPTSIKSFECLAMSAYAAQQTRKGDLAAAKAASLVTDKASRKALTAQIALAKTQPSAAQAC